MWTDSRSWYTKMFIMQNAAIEMHWLMVNHVSRLKKAEKPKMLVWRTEFGRGVFFGGKLNKPCGYWFCQKWLLIISKRPKKSSEWCYFNLTPPTDHGTILRRSPLERSWKIFWNYLTGNCVHICCASNFPFETIEEALRTIWNIKKQVHTKNSNNVKYLIKF